MFKFDVSSSTVGGRCDYSSKKGEHIQADLSHIRLSADCNSPTCVLGQTPCVILRFLESLFKAQRAGIRPFTE